VTSLDDIAESGVVILDTTPQAAVAITGDRLSPSTRRRYQRFRYGPGVFKIDWALAGRVPWADEALQRAGTIHLGGRMEDVVRSERQVASGRAPDRPFTLFAQYAPWDRTRAPAERETAWAYCHVPSGSTVDMTDRIETELERLAPGFRDLVLARSIHTAADMESHDSNYVGGDINAGIADIRQLIFRPTRGLDPYHAGDRVYLCSASTPPGGGVHGMGGHLAALSALRRDLR
jgi:phytoene dehydrogenase-like protein